MDPLQNKVVGIQKAENIPTVMYLNDIADPIHFGNWGGLTTKIFWFLGGLSICGLILTGIWIALKRQYKQSKGTNSKVMGNWKFMNWGFTGLIVGYMYFFMISRYASSWSSIIKVSLILVGIGILTWYIFDYRLKKSLNK
ncbi:hypothetical protein FHS59_004666 [Algoriphagus iocasae]|uniref:Uncharacterized protein n=1 Tax=Algoriphagus iocasae TaxID=1836499 RepID=A0A841ML47_9BACT|nr:PepSY-associated TM helix domain-containing protein [Algoriphagus iocasae]MBB6329002.1 hypothetical protein [Algoriphagus iocasae]